MEAHAFSAIFKQDRIKQQITGAFRSQNRNITYSSLLYLMYLDNNFVELLKELRGCIMKVTNVYFKFRKERSEQLRCALFQVRGFECNVMVLVLRTSAIWSS